MKLVSSNGRRFGYSMASLLLVATAAACGNTNQTSGGGGSSVTSGYDPGPTGGPVVLPGDGNDKATIGSFPVSKACERCHTSIFKDWTDSAHARAITSVATVAENNGLFLSELKDQPGPDPKQFCLNCHSPLVTNAVLTTPKGQDARLPFADSRFDPTALSEGVGCTTCHSYIGSPQRSVAGLSFFQNDFDTSGNTFYGPFSNTVETSAHKSQAIPTFGKDSAQQLCINCHNVFFDRNNDGKIEQPIVGEDLILQNTSAEFDQYFKQGGNKTCIDCHMPIKSGVTRLADGAKIGTDDQKSQAPSRQVRSHKFVGVDYPLDDTDDQSLGERTEMLQKGVSLSLANLKFANNNLSFDTILQNNETGHNFPTGFAFARQLFIEVIITDFNGKFLDGSGRLLSKTDDLCDKASLDSPLGTDLSNCPKPDLQLVNLQLQLVSKIEKGVDANGNVVAVIDPEDGKETVIQNLAGGAVVRTRPIDGKPLNPLLPNEKRSYKYNFAIQGQGQKVNLSVKLRFRNLPPYFLRALKTLSPPQGAELSTAISKLKIIDIATVSQDVQNQ